MPGLRVAHVTIRVIGLPVWLLRVAPVIRLLIRAMAGMTRILLAHRLIAAERRSWLRRRIPRVIRHIANSLFLEWWLGIAKRVLLPCARGLRID